MIEIPGSESASAFAAAATASSPLMSTSAFVAVASADLSAVAVAAPPSPGGAIAMIASAIFWMHTDCFLAASITCLTAEVTSAPYWRSSSSSCSCSVFARSKQISTSAPGRENASSQAM